MKIYNPELLKRVIEMKGNDREISQTIEELSELTVELSRYGTYRFSRSKVIEELSHVQLMTEYIISILDITDKELQVVQDINLKRLIELLEH